jgi:hypothetical protein|tara:strand:- start:373 stop:570 length:198 start_codon:yes stop_codon:yes gene_type:complete
MGGTNTVKLGSKEDIGDTLQLHRATEGKLQFKTGTTLPTSAQNHTIGEMSEYSLRTQKLLHGDHD